MRLDEMDFGETEWSHFLTPQELKLIGASCGEELEKKFYTPVVVQKGMDIPKADRIRQMAEYFQGLGIYFVHKDGRKVTSQLIDVRLAPLDPERGGETGYNPMPYDFMLKINPEKIDYLRMARVDL